MAKKPTVAGSIAANFHEAARSEYLAHYVFTACPGRQPGGAAASCPWRPGPGWQVTLIPHRTCGLPPA
jgi:hypothetical protein